MDLPKIKSDRWQINTNYFSCHSLPTTVVSRRDHYRIFSAEMTEIHYDWHRPTDFG